MDKSSTETPYLQKSETTQIENTLNNNNHQHIEEEFDDLMLNAAIVISQNEQVNKFFSKFNELPLKYRKMIPNMKLKSTSQRCTVCQEDFVLDEIIKKLPCKHIMHRECAKKWLRVNKNCTVCRLDLEKYYSSKFDENIKNSIDCQSHEQCSQKISQKKQTKNIL